VASSSDFTRYLKSRSKLHRGLQTNIMVHVATTIATPEADVELGGARHWHQGSTSRRSAPKIVLE
jgi:hypothetical protein